MSVIATDTFVRANNTDLGTNWTPVPAEGTFQISGNVAIAGNNAVDCAEGYSGATWPNDQWAESTLSGVNASGVGTSYGVSLRCSTSVQSNYRLVGNASGYELGSFSSGSFVSLGNGSGTVFATGDRIYLEMQGTQPVCKKNTTNGAGGATFLTPGTNSTLTAGNAGVAYSSVDATGTITAWAGGNFIVAATAVPLPWYSA